MEEPGYEATYATKRPIWFSGACVEIPSLCSSLHGKQIVWCALFRILVSVPSEQKTIDVENRARYQALRDRWEVLDKTITIPDDDLVDSPPYMELSEDEQEEEEEDSTYCPAGSKSRQMRAGHRASEPSKTEVKRNDEPRRKSLNVGGKGASANTVECGSACQEEQRTCHQATNSGNHDNKLSPTRQSPDFSNGDTQHAVEKNEDTSLETSEIEQESVCTCDFRRRSCDRVLDEEGKALVRILELPCKVFATRQPIDLEQSYPKAKRIILRDVLRTDRNFHYFT